MASLSAGVPPKQSHSVMGPISDGMESLTVTSPTIPGSDAVPRSGSRLESLPPKVRMRFYHYLGYPTDLEYKSYARLPIISSWGTRDPLPIGPLTKPHLLLEHGPGVLVGAPSKTHDFTFSSVTFSARQRQPYDFRTDERRSNFLYISDLCSTALMRTSSFFAKELYPLLYNDQLVYHTYNTDVRHVNWTSTIFPKYITEIHLCRRFTPKTDNAKRNALALMEKLTDHCSSLKTLVFGFNGEFSGTCHEREEQPWVWRLEGPEFEEMCLDPDFDPTSRLIGKYYEFDKSAVVEIKWFMKQVALLNDNLRTVKAYYLGDCHELEPLEWALDLWMRNGEKRKCEFGVYGEIAYEGNFKQLSLDEWADTMEDEDLRRLLRFEKL